MDITTTRSEGDKETLGIVASEGIIGVSIDKDWLASIKNVLGGHVKGYEKDLSELREKVQLEVELKAQALGHVPHG